jgi:hypothetical protein
LLLGDCEGEEEVFVSQASVLGFLQVTFRDSALPPALLEIADDIGDMPTVHEEAPRP